MPPNRAATGKKRKTYPGSGCCTTSLAYGSLAVFASSDRTLKIWDLETGPHSGRDGPTNSDSLQMKFSGAPWLLALVQCMIASGGTRCTKQRYSRSPVCC